MGTSHRHKPGVLGEPNWGSTSSSMTSAAKAEEKADALEHSQSAQTNKKQYESLQKRYANAFRRNYHKTVRNLVRAAGGREKVSKGSSRVLGHAGLAVARDITSTFADIASKGIDNWLTEKGINLKNGRSCLEILDFLRQYLSANVVGMDETAANDALQHVLEKFEGDINEDASNFDDVLNSIMSSNAIVEIIDEFMGIYIFSHLSQNFQEKIEHDRGTNISESTMSDIKGLILDDVRRGYNGHTSAEIDWTGKEGHDFIQKEFNRIIYILCGDED
ncbi:MAG: hypothetical protein HDS04_03715 [Bacteroides sp.]|nr:hypothetical protein [Bacteroides sp.]MBD5328251.1 hypothetical protein [Bacteroides sp.]MBD5328260.1 hypothetical protein [Bacteroides sp.]